MCSNGIEVYKDARYHQKRNPVIMRFLLFSLSEDKDKSQNEVRYQLRMYLGNLELNQCSIQLLQH